MQELPRLIQPGSLPFLKLSFSLTKSISLHAKFLFAFEIVQYLLKDNIEIMAHILYHISEIMTLILENNFEILQL